MGVGDDRADALLKESAVTAAQQRQAAIRLAGQALVAASGHRQTAKGMLREVLLAIGVIAYEPRERPKTSRMTVNNNFRRPGQ
jgi:hypothetical protein